MDPREIDERIAALEASEERFRSTVARFEESDLGAPSLCPDWTRGHVIAHVALNGHSLVNLIEWARTGVERPQYPSLEARAADIERYSTRSLGEHLDALAAARDTLLDAARSLPMERWDFPVSRIVEGPRPVADRLHGRLNEIEIHHVDLDAGYDSADWPTDFVRRGLSLVPERLGPGVEAPFEIVATDLDVGYVVGEGTPTMVVSGPGHALFKWLVGRSQGVGLSAGDGHLPPVPSWG
jgi:maleylpyruvate isomerase